MNHFIQHLNSLAEQIRRAIDAIVSSLDGDKKPSKAYVPIPVRVDNRKRPKKR